MGKADRLGEQPVLQGNISRSSGSREVTKMFVFINNLLLMTAATTKILLRTMTSGLLLFFYLVFLKIPRMHACLKGKLSYT